MPIDSVKIQQIVDMMATPKPSGGWVLDHSYAAAFFNLIEGYIRKSAYKSDRFDPEDAFAQVRFEVWRALEKYGPRPNGQFFADYTLKLKTNNILTNRAKKRNSLKSRLNYISDSYETILSSEMEGSKRNIPSCGPIDLCWIEEYLKDRNVKSFGWVLEDRVETIYKAISTLPYKDQQRLYYKMTALLTNCTPLEVNEVAILKIPLLSPLKLNLYNDTVNSKSKSRNRKELAMELERIDVGDQFITRGGKIFEIRGRTDKGFKVLVLASRKELEVDNEYIKNKSTPYEGSSEKEEKKEDKIRVTPSDAFEESPVETEDTPTKKKKGAKRGRKPKSKIKVKDATKNVKKIKKTSKKRVSRKGDGTVAKTRDGTAKALVIELLKKGPQTRESLAKAILAKGLTKSTTLTKVKNYASVIISMLKSKDKLNVVTLERGKYIIK